jgi:AcrR family transcriptional regulator
VSTQSPRNALSRQAIIDAAATMVSDVGLDQLSLRRLATHLGVTAPALYAHVSDKSDLLRSIAETGFGDLVTRCEAVTDPDPLARIRQLSHAYVEYALAEPEIFRLMFLFRPREISAEGTADGDTVDNELELATQAFALPMAAISEALAAGLIHPDRDPLGTALTLWTVSHGLASVLLLGMGFDIATRDRLIDDVISLTLAGLATAP